ncbi:MAG: anti-sigma factor [Burkholderiaceae bacterium]|nr:anti-sigma factor [Burkholderiaceae bacterium]
MTDHTTDRTMLIAEYTLGLLTPTETAQAQRLLGSDPQAVVDALKWEQAFLELTDRLAPAQLSDSLWEEIAQALGMDATAIAAYPLPLRPEQTAIDNSPPVDLQQAAPSIAPTVAAVAPAILTPATAPQVATPFASPTPTVPAANASEPAPAPIASPQVSSKPSKRQQANTKKPADQTASTGWRLQPKHIGLAAGLLAIAILASRLIPGTPAVPPITILEVAPTLAAILQAPGHSSTPGWVVTMTPHGDVLLHPRVQTETPDQTSVQLWTYSLGLPEPRSLGLIDPNLPVTVPASLMGAIASDQIFEMTQEPEGGSASAGPSGPVLFIGQVVTFGLPVPTPAADTDSGTNP